MLLLVLQRKQSATVAFVCLLGAPGGRELLDQQAQQQGLPWQLICTASFSGEVRIFEVYKG
jgi:hypothetical protein